MFLDQLNSKLFKPLASVNARLYGIGLYALYNRLVKGQLDAGECTPKEARSVISRALIEENQSLERLVWAEDAEFVKDSETDDALIIYRRLRDCGWLMEMDDTGYRRITYFPQIASRLLSTLDSLSGGRSATLAATCQGVYTALLSAYEKPLEQASQIEFAAKASRDFFRDLSDMAGSCREILHKMTEQQAGPQLFQVFFKDFMQGILLGDYTTIKTKSHPYRYRTSTLSVIVEIQQNEKVMGTLVDVTSRSIQNPVREEVRELLLKDLNDIFRIFEGIEKLMERIEWYRSTMTRRTREAMQYASRAIPDIGKKISCLVTRLGQIEGIDELIGAPVIEDSYICPDRVYSPRVKTDPPETTTFTRSKPPVREIAFNHAYDDYLGRRALNPSRLIAFLERNLGENNTLSTSDMVIEGLEDFIDFMHLRDLLHDAVPGNSPYYKLIKHYRVNPIPGEMTTNEYLSAPALLIQRRGLRPGTNSNVD